MPPTSRFENPSTRVYSSPKPTHPDNSTIGDSIDMPQRSVCKGLFRSFIGCGILNDMLNLILYQPEIPPNTGNIIRLCANTGVDLHLVEPLGFELDEPRLRRAGLDYREFASVQTHASLDEAMAAIGKARVFALSTRGQTRYDAPRYSRGDTFLMGPETRGLPQPVLDDLPAERRLRLPMRPGNRSLNLSNAAAVVIYEAWRQLGFDQGA
jgi:tRNA (cytidine/uridine-2'-O-)-methyltransferase